MEDQQESQRYYAEYVEMPSAREAQGIQEVLDRGARKEWHLIGVAGGFPDGGLILFWDTTRPSFGRTTRS
jgi:hypothetical protein